MAKRSRSSSKGNLVQTALPGSLGEALDEIGFRPLGHRIIVGKQPASSPVLSKDWAVHAIELFKFTLPRASHGNWEHHSIAAHQVACQALVKLGQATVTDGGAKPASAPQLPAVLPRWDDIATAVVWAASQSGLLRYRRRGEMGLTKGTSSLPKANIRSRYGCPPAYLAAEAFPAFHTLGLISDSSWTAVAETILWRDDPFEAGMNFADDKRFADALDRALASVPEEITAKIRDILALPANEVDGLVEFARQYSHYSATADEVLSFLQDQSHRLVSELFARRWRLGDGWLSAEECERALFFELDPLSIQMSVEFCRRFNPPTSR
jgi:pellino protein